MALRETITIRPFEAGDETAILAALNRPAPRGAIATPVRDVEEWRWLYERNPAGARIMLGFDEGGEVLAQCAGLSLRARLEGRPTTFCIALDGLNVRSERTGHLRRGLFTATCEAFREAWAGEGEGRYAFLYGAVSSTNPRLGRAPLSTPFLREGFAHVLELPCTPISHADVAVREVERFDGDAAEVFERVALDARAVLVRDASFLNWRYVERPGKPYRRALAYAGTRPIGVAVWRAAEYEGRPAAWLCEWMVPGGEPAGARALLAWVTECARASGLECVVLECSPFARDWSEFQALGFRVRRARHHWIGAAHSSVHDARFFARHLQISLGDLEFT
ncbi:MAG: hypothetical protein JNL28_01680 [Planctomycetes bacterium]|nr:hypothetical protein [Planctomycetota bacterium]